ncbi:MAG: FAD:protein FMN transferase [Thermoleophilia bacterium]|nr:FAD:protein FMN transferase [Thermoleophilia bacterium]
MTRQLEVREFAALGGRVRIAIDDPAAAWLLPAAEEIVRQLHSDLSRFEPLSELSRLNADPRTEVEVSPLMARFIADVIGAARLSGGLVDATCLDAVEAAGYRDSIDFSHQAAPADSPSPLPRHPATPDGRASWAAVEIDPDRGLVRRPAGLRFDSGGLGKGLAADLVAEALDDVHYFSIDCGGDLRMGGTGANDAIVSVSGPRRGDGPVAELVLPSGFAVATSGISRRAWLNPDGRPSHHLIDPGTGLPAFTGVVQATAAAPTAVEAEVMAKSALLVGPDLAAGWLEFGGVVVLDDGALIEVPSPAEASTPMVAL